jgi:hypothetical protein
MPGRYAKALDIRNKSDAADAQAILSGSAAAGQAGGRQEEPHQGRI